MAKKKEKSEKAEEAVEEVVEEVVEEEVVEEEVVEEVKEPEFQPYTTNVGGVPVKVVGEGVDNGGRKVIIAADGCTYHK